MTCRSAQREKTVLLGIGGIAIIGLIWIALAALYHSEKVSSEAATLIGVIVTGLVASAKDAIGAVRAFWTDDRMGKMTDQIAASVPPGTADTVATGKPDDPVNIVPGQ